MPSPLQSIYRELQKPSLPENRETWIKDTHTWIKDTHTWIKDTHNWIKDTHTFYQRKFLIRVKPVGSKVSEIMLQTRIHSILMAVIASR